MLLVDGIQNFKLDVSDYEFTAYSNEYDANWLQVKIRVSDKNGMTWSATAPCLTVMDLVALKDWLNNTAKVEAKQQIDFIENAICFSFDANKSLCVHLDFEFHPNGAQYNYDEDDEHILVFGCSCFDINKLIESVDNLLSRFPIRVVD